VLKFILGEFYRIGIDIVEEHEGKHWNKLVDVKNEKLSGF
jgi:hypothetical protein